MIPLSLLAAFVCLTPSAVDGDTLRCQGRGLVRLLHIDAPELPGHCRAGRACTPGDGWASKASLAALIRRRQISCNPVGYDAYGRILATCAAGATDLSCAQVARGQAVERYGRLRCD